MKTKRGFQKIFLDILNSKVVIGFFIFIILGLAMVLGNNIIYQEGSMDVENNLNVSNTLFVDSSNQRIGIGTSTPTDNLNVIGRVNITGDLFSNNQNVTQWLFNQSDGVGNMSWNQSYYKQLFTIDFNSNLSKYSFGNLNSTDFQGAFNINISSFNKTLPWNQSSANIFPNSLGYNIGIGTTSPSKKLDVAGDLNLSGNGRTLFISDGGTGTIKIANGGSGTLILGSGTGGGGLGNVISGNSGTGNLVINQSHQNTGAIIFISRSLEKMRLNNIGLGIGTTTPSKSLEVNGTTNITDTLWINEVNASKWLFNQSIGNYLTDFQLAFNSNITIIGLGNFSFTNFTNSFNTNVTAFNKTLPWNQSSANIFPGDLANKIGIGTKSPTAKLEVYNLGAGLGETLYGINSSVYATYSNAGIFSASSNSVSKAVIGIATGGTTNYGGYFDASYSSAGTTNYGIYATASNGWTNYAGYFDGDVYVTGNISAELVTDRSNWCDISGAEAITKLNTIKKSVGINEIDKTTMPSCAVVDIQIGKDESNNPIIEKGRDIGAYTSYLTIVNQEQQKQIELLKLTTEGLRAELCSKDPSYSWC